MFKNIRNSNTDNWISVLEVGPKVWSTQSQRGTAGLESDRGGGTSV